MKVYLFAAVPLALAACAHPSQEFDVSGTPAPQAAPGVSFAGTWTYNPDDSDQPGRAMYGGRGGFGGGYGGRGGFGGRGEFGGRGGRGGEGGEGRGRREGDADSLLLRPSGRLVITQTDSSLTISPREGTAYTLFYDGRDVVIADTATHRTFSLSGRWHGKQFQVRRTLPSGAGLIESYEVKKNGQRLVIHMKMQREESNPLTSDFQRVYDRYGPADGGEGNR